MCRATVAELEDAVSKVDPKKKASVGGYRLDSEGNAITKTVQLSKSEMFLTELFETICKCLFSMFYLLNIVCNAGEKMDDYAKATHKKTGRFNLLKFMVDGQMNTEMSSYDFVQDGDLNKSLKHYCLEILDEGEEEFLKTFQGEELPEDMDIQLCSQQTHYCSDMPIQEDYNMEDDEEQKDEL